MLERRKDDYWNIDGPQPIRFVDWIHTIHHIERKTSRWYTWSGGRLTRCSTSEVAWESRWLLFQMEAGGSLSCLVSTLFLSLCFVARTRAGCQWGAGVPGRSLSVWRCCWAWEGLTGFEQCVRQRWPQVTIGQVQCLGSLRMMRRFGVRTPSRGKTSAGSTGDRETSWHHACVWGEHGLAGICCEGIDECDCGDDGDWSESDTRKWCEHMILSTESKISTLSQVVRSVRKSHGQCPVLSEHRKQHLIFGASWNTRWCGTPALTRCQLPTNVPQLKCESGATRTPEVNKAKSSAPICG